MARCTMAGWKLKKAATTGSGPTTPSGAARAAKYPRQNPLSPSSAQGLAALRGKVRHRMHRLDYHPQLAGGDPVRASQCSPGWASD